MANESNNDGGIGFLSILFFIFLVLKLTGYVTWSWWWVTAPLWGGLALAVVFIAIAALFITIDERRKAKRQRRGW